jgi:hypothetical protein
MEYFKPQTIQRLFNGQIHPNELAQDGIFSSNAYEHNCDSDIVSRAFGDLYDRLKNLDHIVLSIAYRSALIYLFLDYHYFWYRKGIQLSPDVRVCAKDFTECDYITSGEVERHFTQENADKMISTAWAIRSLKLTS